MNTEPGVCSLAGGAYVTVWANGREPVTIDGNHAFPGLGLDDHNDTNGAAEVWLEYGGGVSTVIGPGSVAVPGAVAAFDLASSKFGNIEWRELFRPVINAARDGFPLPTACHYYLCYAGTDIYGRSADGFDALHDNDGKLLDVGSLIAVPHLANSLERIAEEGARVFYAGDLAQAIVGHVVEGGGALTMRDMEQYEAIVRPALIADAAGWRIATNPPPAVGGAVLGAMLLACAKMPSARWDSESLDLLIRVQRACLDFRRSQLDVTDDVGQEVAKLINAARDGRILTNWASSSTIHTSAVDDSGNGCAITASAGYGSGEMPAGTGFWLNNGLGEIELLRHRITPGQPGSRLPSNMAPSVARTDRKVLAIGSPGADRITTAIHQVLINTMAMDMPLADAIAHPRVHVDLSSDNDQLMAEPGFDLPNVDLPVKEFPECNMYFGGVAAALYDDDAGFEVASDPRREGAVAICGA